MNAMHDDRLGWEGDGFQNDRGGLSTLRNRGLACCKGSFGILEFLCCKDDRAFLMPEAKILLYEALFQGFLYCMQDEGSAFGSGCVQGGNGGGEEGEEPLRVYASAAEEREWFAFLLSRLLGSLFNVLIFFQDVWLH